MFKKLKNTFTFNDYRTLGNQVRYGKVRDGIFYGISYDIVPLESNHKLFEVIPAQHRDKFVLLSMEINCHARPHTDSGILATINFYVESQNAITTFYKIKTDKPETSKIENQTNGELFELTDLEEYDKFTAKDGEAFILDVTNPHSVTCTQYGIRKALVLQTKEFSYNEVCKMLEETNNL
jgi:hypothetical protein